MEILLISDRFAFDRLEGLSYVLEIASVREDETVIFQATEYMDQHTLTTFDAYHLAYADGDPIVSSDTAFDEVTDDRIAIEDHEGRS